MSEIEPLLKNLEPIVIRLAKRNGKLGITIADVRDEAERLGILAADAAVGTVSALGALPVRLKMEFIGYRKSHRRSQHGRVLRVWGLSKASPKGEDVPSPYREN